MCKSKCFTQSLSDQPETRIGLCFESKSLLGLATNSDKLINFNVSCG